MHIDKVKNQSWSGIPFDRTLYHCRRDQGGVWLALASYNLCSLLFQTYSDNFEVFFLRYEDAIALLTNLKTKEELQLTHHGHLILLLHHISKLFTVFLISAAKDNVIHIYLAQK